MTSRCLLSLLSGGRTSSWVWAPVVVHYIDELTDRVRPDGLEANVVI
jgi:hypothetical protein